MVVVATLICHRGRDNRDRNTVDGFCVEKPEIRKTAQTQLIQSLNYELGA